MNLITHRLVTTLGSLYAAALAVLAWVALPRYLSPPSVAYFLAIALAAIAVAAFPWGWFSGADVPQFEEGSVSLTAQQRAKTLLGFSSLLGPAVCFALGASAIVRAFLATHVDFGAASLGLSLTSVGILWAGTLSRLVAVARGTGSGGPSSQSSTDGPPAPPTNG